MSRIEPLNVSVNKAVLRWAVKRSGKSVDKLMKQQGMRNLKEWLSGKKNPTVRQLEIFSTAVSVPFGYLFFSNPPKDHISIPYFRTRTNSSVTNPSPDLIDTIQIIEQRQDWMREYLIADGAKPLEFVDSVKHTDSHVKTALKIRSKLGIDQEWASKHSTWSDALSEMKNKIENAGIFLSTNGIVGSNQRRPLDPAEFRGFVLVDEYAPFIFVNNKDFKAAQMFTLAHELAHVWVGSNAVFDLHDLKPANDIIENACNQIAAEFLVPMDDIHQKWDKFRRDDNPFQTGARYFKVSEIVVARRALDAKIINHTMFRKFYHKQREKEYSRQNKSNGGDFYNNAKVRVGKMFMKNIKNAVQGDKLLYRDAYNLTGLTRKSFDGMVERIT